MPCRSHPTCIFRSLSSCLSRRANRARPIPRNKIRRTLRRSKSPEAGSLCRWVAHRVSPSLGQSKRRRPPNRNRPPSGRRCRRMPRAKSAGDGSRSLQVRHREGQVAGRANRFGREANEDRRRDPGRSGRAVALWQLAIETVTKAGEPVTAFAALDELAKNYEIDELAVKSRTFLTIARGSRARISARRSP